MKNLYRIGLVAAALASSPAFAQIAPHWYAGAGAGIGNLNASGSDLTNLNNASIDDSDKTYTLRLGYRFHPNFALEAGYYDLGKYTFSGNTFGPGSTNVSGSFKAKSYGLSFVGIAPLSEQFEAYGRVGYARSEIKPNANTSNITYSREDKQNELTYGLGARWMFAKSFGVFGEWMKNDKIEVDSYMVGVDFRF